MAKVGFRGGGASKLRIDGHITSQWLPVKRSTWKWVKHIKGFVRVLGNLESPGV